MIPKKIHYFWFGRNEKTALIKECISRFKVFAPSAEIIEWNELNFDVNAHPYTKEAYKKKKWAFVSDYARIKVLYEEGGIYLDTDMFLVKDISDLFKESFLGKEDYKYISAGIMGFEKHEPFLKKILEEYDSLKKRETIPKILTRVFSENNFTIKIFEPRYFYPFSQETIKYFNKKNPPKESYAVHMWDYSWGNPFIKILKKIGLYVFFKNIAERLNIKSFLKRHLKLE